MKIENITLKLIGIAFVALVCLIASFMVMGLISEREFRYTTAQHEVASTWGHPQTVLGPVLVFDLPPIEDSTQQQKMYVLPKELTITSTIEPETRSRGIFDSIVYTEKVQVTGSFSGADILSAYAFSKPSLVVSLSDTRSIEKQLSLLWNETDVSFHPGTGAGFFGESGIHAIVPLSGTTKEYRFSFEVELKGSEYTTFIPVGEETTVTVTSPWKSPQFIGAYLPSERTLTEEGFSGTWNISSFGRNYPQVWVTGDSVSRESLLESNFGVELYEGVDLYTQVERSVKYAVLFILITFTAFFLFDILKSIQIHPIQYLLVGSALALFYLLLLSLTEHFGFMTAYVVATAMTMVLITTYSISVLKQTLRATLVGVLLLVLYSYMYFVLKLEDYALLFGSVLIFVLIATVMYLTRNIDWFSSTKK